MIDVGTIPALVIVQAACADAADSNSTTAIIDVGALKAMLEIELMSVRLHSQRTHTQTSVEDMTQTADDDAGVVVLVNTDYE
jgi:hypothetical protein